jgi:NADH-quinone oxidoreductase subunit N
MVGASRAAPSVIQSVDYAALAPVLLVVGAAVAVLLTDVMVGQPSVALGAARRSVRRRGVAVTIGGIGLATALGAVFATRDGTRVTFCGVGGAVNGAAGCSFVVSDLTRVAQVLVIGGAAMVLAMSVGTLRWDRLPAGEYVFLLLCSAAGALTLAAARDLITLVVSLELVSLPGFVLVALRRRDSRGGEAAVKAFLLSVASTAVTLFGMGLIYGATGSLQLNGIAAALSRGSALASDGSLVAVPAQVAALGAVLAVAGFAFKIAAVPFHAWVGEVYAGAPAPVAAYLSVVSKTAGVTGLVVLLTEAFPTYADRWSPVLAVMAAVTMTVGNLSALRVQRAGGQVVRVMAWSSVAQAGYVLVPLGSVGGALGPIPARSAVFAYLAAYAVMNLGAFAVVVAVGQQRARNEFADYRGLAATAPGVAITLGFFVVNLAGIPPGLMGLFAKITVVRAAVTGGAGWLAVVVAINVVVGLAYYLPWVASLFLPPTPKTQPVSTGLGVAAGTCLVAAVALSISPEAFLGVLR